jgi:hypothetical protein
MFTTCTVHQILSGDKAKESERVEHVTRMREIRNTYKILAEDLKGRDHTEDLGVDEKNGSLRNRVRRCTYD